MQYTKKTIMLQEKTGVYKKQDGKPFWLKSFPPTVYQP